MKKRFTDTDLHRKLWFRKLPLRFKESWRVLCAECDLIGVWPIDLESLELYVGEPVSLEELVDTFKVKVLENGEELFIEDFVSFQYGDEAGRLSADNKLAPKILRMLHAHGLPFPPIRPGKKKTLEDISPIDAPSIPHLNVSDPPAMGLKNKTKNKEEEKVEEEKKEKSEISNSKPMSSARRMEAWFEHDFAHLVNIYPMNLGKGEALAALPTIIKTKERYDEMELAIKNYSARIVRDKIEPKFQKSMPNFLKEWREWLKPETGTSNLIPSTKPKSTLELLKELDAREGDGGM